MPDNIEELKKKDIKSYKKSIKRTLKPEYDPTNTMICKERSMMLFYNSVDFCKILFKSFDITDIISINCQGKTYCNPINMDCDPQDPSCIVIRPHLDSTGTFSPNSVIQDNDGNIIIELTDVHITLSGYYISPKGGRFDNAPEPYNEIHYLEFNPTWLIEKETEFIEVVTKPIRIDFAAQSLLQIPSSGTHIYASPVGANTDMFCHDFLQFNYLNKIGKSFISRHELFLICQHAEYIGISGSRVSTGNYTVNLADDSSIVNLNGCNKNYFTYRFLGFNDVESRENNDELIKLVLSNSFLKNGQLEFDPAIPNETWSVPCPPSWIPF